jgi:hypothetical protein
MGRCSVDVVSGITPMTVYDFANGSGSPVMIDNHRGL